MRGYQIFTLVLSIFLLANCGGNESDSDEVQEIQNRLSRAENQIEDSTVVSASGAQSCREQIKAACRSRGAINRLTCIKQNFGTFSTTCQEKIKKKLKKKRGKLKEKLKEAGISCLSDIQRLCGGQSGSGDRIGGLLRVAQCLWQNFRTEPDSFSSQCMGNIDEIRSKIREKLRSGRF